MSKGIPEPQARAMAAEIIQDKSKAHEILVKEELGINSEELKGSAMEAAITSFILFAVGAIIPVFPFFFLSGFNAVILEYSSKCHRFIYHRICHHTLYRKKYLVFWYATGHFWLGCSGDHLWYR
jgi:hypothetical protein